MPDGLPNPFDAEPTTHEARLADGLSRIATAIRAHDWAGASSAGLTPTQGRALAQLNDAKDGLRLGALAATLGVSAPTASDAMAALVRKGLVLRSEAREDRRAARFSLSEAGKVAAANTASWPAFLVAALATLGDPEQAILNRALIKLIRTMQERGEIPVQRMCLTCRFFRPYAHSEDAARPHHCAFVDAAFGDRRLRLDCPEHEAADVDAQAALWSQFEAAKAPA